MPNRDLTVPISVEWSENAGPTRRTGEPVTFGVPFPCGRADKECVWQLVDSVGRSVPIQARTLDVWPDGSVRWLLVDGLIDVTGNKPSAFRLVPAADLHLPSPLQVEDRETEVVVNTGAARFEFRRGGGFPLTNLTVADTAPFDSSKTAFRVTDSFGRVHRTVVTQVSVTETGPVRATVRVEGALEHPGTETIEITAWINLYAGLPIARVALRLRNPQAARHPGGFWDLGDAGSVLLKDVSWRIELCQTPDAEHSVRCSPERGVQASFFQTPFELYQDSSGGENWRSTNHLNRQRRVPIEFRGYRIRSAGSQINGLRASPIVALTSGAAQVSIAVPQFWQNFPKAIEASDSALVLRFLPAQCGDLHEIQGGEQKTHHLFVAFGPDGITSTPLDWCRSPVVCRVDPTWVLSSEAVPWLAPDNAEHAALVAAAVEGPDTFERKREVIDEYGWRNFGDVYGDHEAVRHRGTTPLVSHYNNQYDAIAGFVFQYLRGGNAKWWSMATELAAHVVDIDVYHTTRDKWSYNHGMFWHTFHYGDADTATHRTYPRAATGVVHGGGPSPDHNYTTGLMLHYFLTGEPASRETIIDLAEFVVDADDGRKTIFRWLSGARTGFASASGSYAYHGPGRGPGNSLNALVDGHRLSGDSRFLDKAEELIERVIHPNDNIESNRLDDPENKWFYLMFLQSLGKYLSYKSELGQLDRMYGYARAALLHYARWMAVNEYPYLDRPERLVFPTETWAAHEVRKSDVFYYAAMHTDGTERARFVERGRFFFEYSMRTLAGAPTRTLARPVIVLLSSGLMRPWYESAQRKEPPPHDANIDFGLPGKFIPQKQIARQRAKALLGVAAVVLVTTMLLMASCHP